MQHTYMLGATIDFKAFAVVRHKQADLPIISSPALAGSHFRLCKFTTPRVEQCCTKLLMWILTYTMRPQKVSSPRMPILFVAFLLCLPLSNPSSAKLKALMMTSAYFVNSASRHSCTYTGTVSTQPWSRLGRLLLIPHNSSCWIKFM